MNNIELIEKAKRKLGVDTDYKLAKKLDIDSCRISDYRKKKRVPDVYAIAKFAEVLEVDPWTLVKEIEAQTEKNAKRRAFWSKVTTVFFFGVILNMSPTPSEAATMLQVSDSTLYIMSNDQQARYIEFEAAYPNLYSSLVIVD